MSQSKAVEEKSGASAKGSRWSGLMPGLAGLDESADLITVLQQLLRLTQRAVPEHSAGIFLLDEETRTIQGQVTDLFDRELNVGHGALSEALRQNIPFVISDLSDRRRAEQSSIESRIRSQIVVPIQLTAQVRGALILRSRQTNAYTKEDGEELARFTMAGAAKIDSALIRQKMHKYGASENERDMLMAQEIMARLIPRTPPKVPGFDLASLYIPAKVVGGDLLDYVILPDDHFGILVADAAGNGVPAALLMTGFRALFRGLIKNDFNIRAAFRKANNQLIDSSAPHQFVSAFFASVDTATRRMIYVNAGHVPPLLFRDGQLARKLDMGGPVLGILPGASYHEDSGVLHPQDILVCFSDGLSEAESAAGEVFDAQQIQRVVVENQQRSAQEICAALQEEATDLVGSTPRDDLTICVLKFP